MNCDAFIELYAFRLYAVKNTWQGILWDSVPYKQIIYWDRPLVSLLTAGTYTAFTGGAGNTTALVLQS